MSNERDDNSMRSSSTGYVTADGHLLYVYDSTSSMTDGGTAFAVDDAPDPGSWGSVGPNHRVTRIDDMPSAIRRALNREAMPAEDYEDALDSFSALFLAYDAADNVDLPSFDDEDGFDEEASIDEMNAFANEWRLSRGSVDKDDRLGNTAGMTIGDMLAHSELWSDGAGAEEANKPADPDLAGLNALMDALTFAEGANEEHEGEFGVSGVGSSTLAESAWDNARAAFEPPSAETMASPHSAPAEVFEAPVTTQARPSVRRHATGNAIAVGTMAEVSPEAQAAIEALQVRRAQSRRRLGIYAFLATGVIMVCVLSLFVNYLLGLDESVTATAGGTAAVAREDFVRTATIASVVEPVGTTDVTSPMAGTIEKVYVADGDLVEAGNILFSVSNANIAAAIASATDELAKANEELTRANAAVVAAYNVYNSEVESYRSGHNPGFDEARLRGEIEMAEEARTRAYNRAEAARVALETVNSSAASCDVTAPVDGAITNLRISPGMSIVMPVGDEVAPALQVADVSSMRARIQVSLADIDSIEVGSTAQVSLAALPDVVSDAIVESVADEPAEGTEQYEVSLLVISPDTRMRPGDAVTVTFATQVEHDVLVVPAKAVRDEGAGASVWVVTDEETGRTERRLVSVGQRNDQLAVIVSGLDEGEIVGLPW